MHAGQMGFAVDWCANLLDGNELIEEATAGGGHKSKFVSVVYEGAGENARFLEEIAVKVERRDRVAGVVDDLGQAFAMRAQDGKGVHNVVELVLFHGA
jgi:hypothetical protein